eukprot:COSAG04_NODE_4349_length_2144_cov_1.490954_3_plen_40_part_01
MCCAELERGGAFKLAAAGQRHAFNAKIHYGQDCICCGAVE